MKSFKNLQPEQVDADTTKKYRSLIIDKLENVEFSPFKNLDNSLSIVSSEKSIGYFVSYDIFNESRSSSLNYRPTSEHIGAYTPRINRSNIQEWSYTISPDSEFLDHSVSHVVNDSKYIETCNTCNGSREVDCSKCSGNGKCTSCSGRGENNCECGNGNCSYCAGRGDVVCNRSFCNGAGTIKEVGGNIKTCPQCKGAGRTRCVNCSGSGKHSKCNGTGKLKCNSCNGSGNCTNCKGKGKVTCYTCQGQGNLIYYLMVTANYTNSNESLQLTSSIESYNPIKINELSSKNEIVKENIENEFNIENLSKYFEIIDINNFLVERKKSFGISNILKERVQIISVPIYTIKYSLNNKEYTSYFIGEQDHYFYLNNPLKDYNEEIEKKINSLISQSDLSNAIALLKEQVSRYESIDDIENRDKSSGQIEELKLNIQKDSMKGAFIAQLLFMLFDVSAIYFMVRVCGRNSESSLIFLWLSIPFILVRIGYYFKYLAPQFAYREIEDEELYKYYNGDEDHDFYVSDIVILKYLRIAGIAGLIILLMMTSGRRGMLSDSIVTSTIIYALFFAASLLTTMMLDLYVNRKLSSGILKLRNKNQRILRSASLNTMVFAGTGIITFLIASFFVDDKEVMYMWGGYDYYHGSSKDGLNSFLIFTYVTLLLGVIGFLFSNGLINKLIGKKNLSSNTSKVVNNESTPINDKASNQLNEKNKDKSTKSKKGLLIVLTISILIGSGAIYWFFVRVPELRTRVMFEEANNEEMYLKNQNASSPIDEKVQVKEIKSIDEVTNGNITATFEYVEMGDYYHLVFKDDKGVEWDFGNGENQLGNFDFGQEQANSELVGKEFVIAWESKKVETIDSRGFDIKTDELSIKNIELAEFSDSKFSIADVIGVYNGLFGKNTLNLTIESIDKETYETKGWSEVKGTKRELTGTFEETENTIHFNLEEPGDDEWDGIFEFTISTENYKELKGGWKSNNGKISRTFTLTKSN
jgi:hypothetical protein